MAEPDSVSVVDNNVAVAEITDRKQLRELTAFVNRYEAGWEVPWYGPPVGRVYFVFRSDRRVIGNFYAGPRFFGRDFGNFYSRSASESEMAELSKISGYPVAQYLGTAKQ